MEDKIIKFAMYAALVGMYVCPIMVVINILVGNALGAVLMLGCTFLNMWTYKTNKNRLGK